MPSSDAALTLCPRLRRYQQLTKADMEATLPPAWADILWQAYRYIDEFGCAPQTDRT
jgi:hypothetical protein